MAAVSKGTRKAKEKALSSIEDNTIQTEIRNLINDLVLTSDDFDTQLVVQLMEILRRQPEKQLRWSYDLVWSKLRRKHSQLRWKCVQLLNHFFLNSARIRKWLIADLEEFVCLCICPSYSHPSVNGHSDVIMSDYEQLPPPTAFASLLRNKSIRFLLQWNNKYGIFYKRLSSCWDLLNRDMKGVFDKVMKNLQQLEEYKLDRARIERSNLEKKMHQARSLFTECLPEVSLNLTQAEEAINLLLNPTEATSGKEEPTADSSFDIATHLDAAASSRIVENADNRILIQSLDEALLLLRRENESTLTRVKEILAELSAHPSRDSFLLSSSSSLSELRREVSRTVTDIESVRKRAAEKLDIVRIRSGVESTHLNKSTPSSSKTSARAKKRKNSDNQSEQSHSKLKNIAAQSKETSQSEAVSSAGGISDVTDSDDDVSDLEDVVEKEGIEFMSSADIATAIGEQDLDEQSSRVSFSVPNPNYNPDLTIERKSSKSRRKKSKLSKKIPDKNSRSRLKKKLKLKKL
ncbi:uncharacterized protein LOC134848372 [Symsagittifera roscoffensis]|uniref:uncharacterized protein LOC134848372 n=1 Tax=Symsagittifera roscoffensis TaxID=84072 RepID=UPI00307BEE32